MNTEAYKPPIRCHEDGFNFLTALSKPYLSVEKKSVTNGHPYNFLRDSRIMINNELRVVHDYCYVHYPLERSVK